MNEIPTPQYVLARLIKECNRYLDKDYKVITKDEYEKLIIPYGNNYLVKFVYDEDNGLMSKIVSSDGNMVTVFK